MKTSVKTQTIELYNAIYNLENLDQVANFCCDLMTEDEIVEFGKRFRMAKLLNSGESQRKIAKEMEVSITTVTRVNKWLKNGMGGYKAVLAKMGDQSLDKVKSVKLSHHHKAKFAVL